MIFIPPSLPPPYGCGRNDPTPNSHEDIDGPFNAKAFNLLAQCTNVRKLQPALPRERRQLAWALRPRQCRTTFAHWHGLSRLLTRRLHLPHRLSSCLPYWILLMNVELP